MTTTYQQLTETEIQCKTVNPDGSVTSMPLILAGEEWQKLNGETVDLTGVTVEWLTTEDIDNMAAEEEVQNFRSSRQSQLNTATVTTQLGNIYDADETSINRMTNSILAATDDGLDETDLIEWSLADTGTGIMTDVPLSDLREARKLAMVNMRQLWKRPE